jgi:hypothetical protein
MAWQVGFLLPVWSRFFVSGCFYVLTRTSQMYAWFEKNTILKIFSEGGGGCCIHSAEIELFGCEPNYWIELSELKPNVNLNINLNTSKSQMNRYLENLFYPVVAGNLKIQNSPTAMQTSWLWVVRISSNRWGTHLRSSPERRKCHFRSRVSRFQIFSPDPLELCVVKKVKYCRQICFYYENGDLW